MDALVENPNTDELHDLQPLFEAGLWIFGPEYEGIQFASNKSLAKIIREYLGGTEDNIEKPRRRPDLIAFPDRSLGVYASDDYDEGGEVCGFRKILIVELKKGGFSITDKERRQAEDYATALVKSGKISVDVKIICYVLGARIETKRIKIEDGQNIEVIPRSYNTVLQQANARTFNLIRKIRESKGIGDLSDKEIREVLAQREVTDTSQV